MTVHPDIDVRDLEKTTPQDIENWERRFYQETDKQSLRIRILRKTMYAGAKYEILPAYDGCHVDKNGEPLPEIGIFGLMAMTVAFPYYCVRESLVSARRRMPKD
jgi:hypothetical protein